MKYLFCPRCGHGLGMRADGLQTCEKQCGYTHYDNPVPVVATLVPIDGKVVLVKRGVDPFKGGWCLPRGHIDRYEHPKHAATREVLEEANIDVRIEKLLSVCNPSPKDHPLNVLSIFYLARYIDGELREGSDSLEVGLFGPDELPDLCFRSDIMIISEWYLGTWGEITGIDLTVKGEYE